MMSKTAILNYYSINSNQSVSLILWTCWKTCLSQNINNNSSNSLISAHQIVSRHLYQDNRSIKRLGSKTNKFKFSKIKCRRLYYCYLKNMYVRNLQTKNNKTSNNSLHHQNHANVHAKTRSHQKTTNSLAVKDNYNS